MDADAKRPGEGTGSIWTVADNGGGERGSSFRMAFLDGPINEYRYTVRPLVRGTWA